MKLGKTSRSRGQSRPHLWKAGPDPVEHKKYLVWLQQRNQAQWREETWEIPFAVWRELWQEHWPRRGRGSGDYCMSRLDWSLPWTLDNVAVISRNEHSRLQHAAMQAGWRSIAQKRSRAQRGLDT